MLNSSLLRQHSAIRVIHGKRALDATLEYSPAHEGFELVLHGHAQSGTPLETRLVLTDWTLDRIELTPEGKLQLQY